ncbi:hypothetical protein ISCGN_010272 [Ixodes scapularis]
MHEAGEELKQRQGGHAGEGNLTARSEFKWRTQMVKKERFTPNLRMPQEDRRRRAPQKASGQSGATAIMIRRKRGITVCPEWETDRNGRVCSVEVLYHGELHKFVSVYAPNEVADRTDFFKNLRQHVDTPCKTVLAGDFNCVLSERDCSKRLRSDASRVELRKILREFDLVDAKEDESTEDPAYTHRQGDCHARLGRVYLSGDLPTASPVLDVWPVAFSDPALVKETMGRPAPRVQKSSWWSGWKLNESLLEDEPLRVQIKELIESRSKGVEENQVHPRSEGALPKISEAVRKQINRKITISEVKKAIKNFTPRKSPGIDGLGSSFYKAYVELLSPILREVFSDILKRRLLPPFMRQAVTVLIPNKKAQGTPEVGNFRPVSLLTSDYKILAKIIAKRLEWGLRDVIGEHQTYGVKGRTISTNLHTMRVVYEAAQVLQCPLAVLQVDLSKAFDRVCHAFLFRLLENCGIGSRLLRYVQICYRSITTRLLVNGDMTAPISVTRSVRQGCPMSPILFALYLEPLCRTIIGDANIRGLSLLTGSLKVLAYADDVAVVCSSRTQVREPRVLK